MRKPINPYLVLALGVVAVSGAAVFIKLSSAPPLVIAGYRLLLASLMLFPLAWLNHRQEFLLLSRRQRTLLVASGLALAMHFAAWVSSLRYTSVASSTVLVSTQPIFVMILSYLLHKEKVSRQQLVGTGLALAGSLLIGLADTGGTAPAPLRGDILALIGALAAAVYFLCGKTLRSQMAVIPYAASVYGISAIMLLLLASLTGNQLWPYSPREWLLFAALALICTVIGHSSLNWALAYLPTAAVGIATLGEPLGASIMAYIIWREVPAPLQLAGSALLLSGILLFLMENKN
ncbi:MAG: DMT family transporter [Firmicutes bacterium]|nr:DMT family transporter [Bacillota bacterium]